MGTITYTAKRDIEPQGPALSITDAFTSSADDSINAASSSLSGFVQDQWVQIAGLARSSGWYQVKANSTSGKILTLTPPVTHLRLPGVSGNYASTPDSAANSVTGDLELIVEAAIVDWTPAAIATLIAKWNTTGNQRSYALSLNTDGTLNLSWSADGTAVISKNSTLSMAGLFANGVTAWLRATLDVNNGAAGNDVKFYTSANGVTWTQLGTTVTTAGTTSVFNSTAVLEVGSMITGTSQLAIGRIYYASLLNGLAGPVAAAFDPTRGTRGAGSFVALTGETWTINSSGTPPALLQGPRLFDEGAEYLNLPAISGNYASTPDSVATSITGDIDLRIQLAANDWTPSPNQCVIGKAQSTSLRSYILELQADGTIILATSPDGTAGSQVSGQSTVGESFVDGSKHWIRATLDVNDGAAHRVYKFYTSDDYDPVAGSGAWTQLGATVTTAGATTINDNASPTEIGSILLGTTDLFSGKVYYVEVRNGIDGPVAAAFDTGRAAAGASSLVAYTGETWTINTSGGTPAALVRTTPVTITGYKRGLGQSYQLEFYSEQSDRSVKAVRSSQTAIGGGQPEVVYSRREVRMAVTAVGSNSDMFGESVLPQWREMFASSFAGEQIIFDRYGLIASPIEQIPAVLDDDGYQETRVTPDRFKLSFNLLLLV